MFNALTPSHALPAMIFFADATKAAQSHDLSHFSCACSVALLIYNSHMQPLSHLIACSGAQLADTSSAEFDLSIAAA